MKQIDQDGRKQIEQLTDAHREVLELGAQGYTSKEIARKLTLSPPTVDQRFARARSILRARDRRETVRLYVKLRGSEYDPTIYDPITLVADQSSRPASDLFETEERRSTEQMAGEAPSESLGGPRQSVRGWLPFPTREARTNELFVSQRLFWLCAITIASLIAARMIIEALGELTTLLKS